MIDAIPLYLNISFILITAVTLYFFYRFTNRSKVVLIGSVLWITLTGILGYIGFYSNTAIVPPRFTFLAPPTVIVIITFFITKQGRQFIDTFNMEWMTYLHTIRIPVEFILLGIFIYGAIPQIMTFEGANFDIIAGLTAPFIAYWGLTKKKLSRNILLAWNVICTGLLLTIVTLAVLASPSPFQQIAFDQPNIAVLHFPFVWLAGFVVPVVLFAHLSSIRQLILRKGKFFS